MKLWGIKYVTFICRDTKNFIVKTLIIDMFTQYEIWQEKKKMQ